MIGYHVVVKTLFFDAPKVIGAMDKVTACVFSKFGAYVRQTARQSIHNRKKPSAPGKPPSSHTGLLKHFIYFAYDPRARSVVIGPVRIHERPRGGGVLEVPDVLEHGGRTAVNTGRYRRHQKIRTTRYIQIKARPYMQPAFEKEKPNLPNIWKNCLRG